MIFGTAAAASSRSTVMRTISEPAWARAATWRTVASTSAVSVLVIDCTTIGAPPPTVTLPTWTGTQVRRSLGAAELEAEPKPDMEFPSPKQGRPEHARNTRKQPGGSARNIAMR